MKIVGIPGSSSRNSINKNLVEYAARLFDGAETEILDLNDYELPLFSVDMEKEIGYPDLARQFLDKIASADAIVVSLAEHNGSFSVAFKNIFDWASRQHKQVFQDKPMLLMAASTGGRGGKTVLEVAQLSLTRYGANIRATFSFPKFDENFSVERSCIINEELDAQLREVVRQTIN